MSQTSNDNEINDKRCHKETDKLGAQRFGNSHYTQLIYEAKDIDYDVVQVIDQSIEDKDYILAINQNDEDNDYLKAIAQCIEDKDYLQVIGQSNEDKDCQQVIDRNSDDNYNRLLTAYESNDAFQATGLEPTEHCGLNVINNNLPTIDK